MVRKLDIESRTDSETQARQHGGSDNLKELNDLTKELIENFFFLDNEMRGDNDPDIIENAENDIADTKQSIADYFADIRLTSPETPGFTESNVNNYIKLVRIYYRREKVSGRGKLSKEKQILQDTLQDQLDQPPARRRSQHLLADIERRIADIDREIDKLRKAAIKGFLKETHLWVPNTPTRLIANMGKKKSKKKSKKRSSKKRIKTRSVRRTSKNKKRTKKRSKRVQAAINYSLRERKKRRTNPHERSFGQEWRVG